MPDQALVEVRNLTKDFDVSRPWLNRVIERSPRQLLRLGDVPLIHAADDARFALLGGTFVGEGALLRFYVLHCVGLPLGIAVLMAVHFWRVRKDGGISGPL